MSGILKSPAEGCGGFVVLPDVTDQLSGEVGDRGEDSPSDEIALDFGKPDLDLIEPTGIGRGVMDPYRWIGLEELENILGFMCAQVVGDDMNLSALRLTGDNLAQKVDKLGAGMPRGGLSHDVAGASVQRCIQGERTMTKIFKAMPFGSARGERQNRVKSVQRLDSALLIDTEDRRVYRGLKVQANDVGRLLFKLRIIASHVTTQPMRLNSEMAPDTAHARPAKAQLFGQPIASPVGRTVSRPLTGGLQDTRLGLSCTGSAWTTAITRIESGQTLLLKALLPIPDILVTAIQPLPNFSVRMTCC